MAQDDANDTLRAKGSGRRALGLSTIDPHAAEKLRSVMRGFPPPRPRSRPRWPSGRPRYQCSPSFEPSAAAVMIAGIPIATVASAIARASIMTIPLVLASSRTSDQELRNRFSSDIYRAPASGVFRRIAFCFALVAIIGPAFRGLWRNWAVPERLAALEIICSTRDRPLGECGGSQPIATRLYGWPSAAVSCGSATSVEVRYTIATVCRSRSTPTPRTITKCASYNCASTST